MKQIMMPVRPKWTAKILSGEKTLEIRKTAPKEWVDYLNGKTDKKPEPMIVNIYCTKGDKEGWCMVGKGDNKSYFATFDRNDVYNVNRHYVANGNVVAKFTLKTIHRIILVDKHTLENSCLTTSEIIEYMGDRNTIYTGDRNTIYAWHISDLEIFGEPKKLSEFYTLKCNQKKRPCNIKDVFGVEECHRICKLCKPLTKAPQSWCYVEERE